MDEQDIISGAYSYPKRSPHDMPLQLDPIDKTKKSKEVFHYLSEEEDIIEKINDELCGNGYAALVTRKAREGVRI